MLTKLQKPLMEIVDDGRIYFFVVLLIVRGEHLTILTKKLEHDGLQEITWAWACVGVVVVVVVNVARNRGRIFAHAHELRTRLRLRATFTTTAAT